VSRIFTAQNIFCIFTTLFYTPFYTQNNNYQSYVLSNAKRNTGFPTFGTNLIFSTNLLKIYFFVIKIFACFTPTFLLFFCTKISFFTPTFLHQNLFLFLLLVYKGRPNKPDWPHKKITHSSPIKNGIRSPDQLARFFNVLRGWGQKDSS